MKWIHKPGLIIGSHNNAYVDGIATWEGCAAYCEESPPPGPCTSFDWWPLSNCCYMAFGADQYNAGMDARTDAVYVERCDGKYTLVLCRK